MNDAMKSTKPVQSILGIHVKPTTKTELLEYIRTAIKNESKIMVLSGNIHAFNLAYERPWMKAMFNHANFIRIDGAGVKLGAKLLGINIDERMTWADFAWDLGEFCQRESFTLFLLGAEPGIANEAAMKLMGTFPNLQITGIHHGYFDKTTGSNENNQVLSEINYRKPDILIVGFGMPTQERWLMENWDAIDAHVVFTGGAVFDYVSNTLKRPPKWMTEHGFEWLGRMLIDPKRLWKRYLIGNPIFFWRVFRQRIGWLDVD